MSRRGRWRPVTRDIGIRILTLGSGHALSGHDLANGGRVSRRSVCEEEPELRCNSRPRGANRGRRRGSRIRGGHQVDAIVLWDAVSGRSRRNFIRSDWL